MFIEAVSEVATQIVASGTIKAEGVGDVCASAPTGVEPYVNDILGWVKYGVIAIIIGSGFASTGALVVGKFAQMGRPPSSARQACSGPSSGRSRSSRSTPSSTASSGTAADMFNRTRHVYQTRFG